MTEISVNSAKRLAAARSFQFMIVYDSLPHHYLTSQPSLRRVIWPRTKSQHHKDEGGIFDRQFREVWHCYKGKNMGKYTARHLHDHARGNHPTAGSTRSSKNDSGLSIHYSASKTTFSIHQGAAYFCLKGTQDLRQSVKAFYKNQEIV